MAMNQDAIIKKMRDMENKLITYSEAYYKHNRPLVSDGEYDRLFDSLVELEKQYPELKNPLSPTVKVQSDLDSFLTEAEHTVPVLSLDKAYSVDEIMAFVNRCKNEASNKISFTLEEKIDGLSIVLYYSKGILRRALTRGNGHVGNDVTVSALRIKDIPHKLTKEIDIAVRGEVYITKKSFEKINSTLEEPYSSSRNLASGLLRRIEKSNLSTPLDLDIFIYEGWAEDINSIREHQDMLLFLKELGFRINPNYTVFSSDGSSLPSISEIDKYIKIKTEQRSSLDYDIDGLVLKLNNFNDRESMGYTEHHPRWAIAYKFESPMGKSRVLQITLGVGRTGRITPVAILDKVELLGASITKATLHNSDYINALELAIGDEVSISRRGDVIPAIEDVVEKNNLGNTTYKLGEFCPSCGTKLITKGANLFCPNSECPDRVKGEIEYFVSKDCMDIEGVGPSVVNDLINCKAIKSYDDLYYVDYNSVLSTLAGYKERKITAIINAVNKSKDQPFIRVLTSIGIEGVGLSTSEKLINGGITSFERFFEIADNNEVEFLTSINEIGESTALNIIRTFSSPVIRNRIERLRAAGLNMMTDKDSEVLLNNSLNGQSWCVTGSISGYKNPDLAMEEIKKRGGRVVSGVSKKTTHLLVGSAPGSKLQKALSFGTTIIKDSEFSQFLENADKQGGIK